MTAFAWGSPRWNSPRRPPVARKCPLSPEKVEYYPGAGKTRENGLWREIRHILMEEARQ